jgi:hypothetical protein
VSIGIVTPVGGLEIAFRILIYHLHDLRGGAQKAFSLRQHGTCGFIRISFFRSQSEKTKYKRR